MEYIIEKFREYPDVLRFYLKEEYCKIKTSGFLEVGKYYFLKFGKENENIYSIKDVNLIDTVDKNNIKILAAYKDDDNCFFLRDDFDIQPKEIFKIHKILSERTKNYEDMIEKNYIKEVFEKLKNLSKEKKEQLINEFPTNILSKDYCDDVLNFMGKNLSDFIRPPNMLTAICVGFVLTDMYKNDVGYKNLSLEERLQFLKNIKKITGTISETLLELGKFKKFEDEYKEVINILKL